MTVAPNLHTSYATELRRARLAHRVATAAKLVLAATLALTLAAGITAAFTEIVATQLAAQDWKG